MKLPLKYFLGKLLLNKCTGSIIKLLYNDIKRHGLKINLGHKALMPNIVAHLYFGSYESAEIRFIKKYLSAIDLPIIELGSSLGIVGSIAAKLSRSRVVGVEANKNLVEFSSYLIETYNIQNYQILNYALSLSDDMVPFSFGQDNTLGKIGDIDSNDTPKVPGIRFNQIIKQTGIVGEYVLISDIEGAEIFFIYFQADLSSCNLIIIELHEFVYQEKTYAIPDMVAEIYHKGFKTIAQYGNCFVFEKK